MNRILHRLHSLPTRIANHILLQAERSRLCGSLVDSEADKPIRVGQAVLTSIIYFLATVIVLDLCAAALHLILRRDFL